MRPSRVGAVGVVALVQFVLVACSSAPPAASQAIVSEPPSASPSLPNTGPSAEPSVEPSVEPSPSVDPTVPQFADFSAATFSNGANITNEWLPLQPGRRWITDGVTIEEGERIPHRITFTVTNLTKVIDDVKTVVVWVEDYSDGVLVEKEIAFYAQDDAGTVWYFGEHPEEYEDGEFVAAPTWIAGLDDARPGIKMFADPAGHTETWYQGWGPKVEWSDFGRLDAGGTKDCVKAGCFEDVDVFAESSDGEPGIFQLKSYARGVGEIRVGWRGEAESREELELKSTTTLKGAALAKFDQMALALEAHAYKISATPYGMTERMMPAG
jgi:hypothetical protein